MLEEHVSFHSLYLAIFFHRFPFVPLGLYPFLIKSCDLQRWPTSELSPVQALSVMIAYEKRTGESIEQKDKETGKVKLCDILTQEDFNNASKVSEFQLYILKKGFKILLSSVCTRLVLVFFEYLPLLTLS